jgi:hypothetical protein
MTQKKGKVMVRIKKHEVDRRMPTFKKGLRESVIDGTKTQTRRIIKDQSFTNWAYDMNKCPVLEFFKDDPEEDYKKKCPYGKPGEIQVLREPLKRHIYHPEKENRVTDTILYADDGAPVIWSQECNGLKKENLSYKWKWKNDKLPAIFMPTEMGRYLFRIFDIWVERIQDIGFEDCLDEGVKEQDIGRGEKMYYDYIGEQYSCVDPIESFRTLWDSINREDGKTWDDNPWVWAIEFEKQESEEE